MVEKPVNPYTHDFLWNYFLNLSLTLSLSGILSLQCICWENECCTISEWSRGYPGSSAGSHETTSPGEGSWRKPGCVAPWRMQLALLRISSSCWKTSNMEVLEASVNLQTASSSKLGFTEVLRCSFDKSHSHFWIFSLILLSVTNASSGF